MRQIHRTAGASFPEGREPSPKASAPGTNVRVPRLEIRRSLGSGNPEPPVGRQHNGSRSLREPKPSPAYSTFVGSASGLNRMTNHGVRLIAKRFLTVQVNTWSARGVCTFAKISIEPAANTLVIERPTSSQPSRGKPSAVKRWLKAIELTSRIEADPHALFADVVNGWARRLPTCAHSVFIRLSTALDATETFKQKKHQLVLEGFDPRTVDDLLFFRDPKSGAYRPIDAAGYGRIVDGTIRL